MALHTTTLTAIRIELYLHTVLAQHPSYLQVPSAPSAQHAALTPIRSLSTPIDYHFTYPPKPAHCLNVPTASYSICPTTRPPAFSSTSPLVRPPHQITCSTKRPPTPPPPSQHVSPPKHLPTLLSAHRKKTFPLSLPSPPPRTILNRNSHSPVLSHSSSTSSTPCNASRACKIDAPATSTVKDRTTNGRPQERSQVRT